MTEDSQWPGFSSDAFLDVLTDVYFAGAEKAIVECDGVRVRTLVTVQHRAVSGFWQMPFFLEPLAVGVGGTAIQVPYLATVVRATTKATEAGPAGLVASPFVRWGDFATWDAFVDSRPELDGIDRPGTLMRKSRRLARQVGALNVTINDADPAVFETILRWKSLQYRRTGIFDQFAIKKNRDLYHVMRERGLFVVSSLRAGKQLVAGSIGSRIGKRFLFRLPAFDIDVGRHSPGSILNYHLIKSSFEAGDEEFDFLAGAEVYKYAYATHVRWLGPVGREPRGVRLNRVVRARAGSAFQNHRAQFDLRGLAGRLNLKK